MNLAAAERFLSRLPIKDRDSHASVPFHFKFNQSKLHKAAQEQIDEGRPIRLLIDKARRVTASSWTEGLLFCHNLALEGSHSLIVAHEYKTSKELFRVPKDFLPAVPWLNLRAVEREITFPFPSRGSHSTMQIITAGKDTSGRGFTLSALHCSEAAHYISPYAFISLLPALSNHKDTIGVIESTPNGSEGDGEVFHDMYWDAASGKSEWKAVFLSWTDDPACVADEHFAHGAPVDDEERDLLARGFSKPQLAWRRLRIASPECGGSVDTFHQEYPTNAEESFIASGMPAFSDDERRWAKSQLHAPIAQGFLERNTTGEFDFRAHPKGDLRIWEHPKPGHYYYLGMDMARGIEGRDFSAIVGMDGTTGHQVFTYAGYCVPEVEACYANSLGRRYNKAMINGDLTGGYGSGALYTMRELLRYPNLYRWKGKDDKAPGTGGAKNSLWIDITSYIRTALFEYFRIGLREAAATDGDLGITLFDEQLASQIERCSRKDTRFEVEQGHDDILFAAMIANLSRAHWAPPRAPNRMRDDRDDQMEEAIRKMRAKGDVVLDDASLSLQRHHAEISRSIARGTKNEDFVLEEF